MHIPYDCVVLWFPILHWFSICWPIKQWIIFIHWLIEMFLFYNSSISNLKVHNCVKKIKSLFHFLVKGFVQNYLVLTFTRIFMFFLNNNWLGHKLRTSHACLIINSWLCLYRFTELWVNLRYNFVFLICCLIDKLINNKPFHLRFWIPYLEKFSLQGRKKKLQILPIRHSWVYLIFLFFFSVLEHSLKFILKQLF